MEYESEAFNKAVVNYESFHKNPINKLIHSIAIPQIIWTSAIYLSYIPFPVLTNMSYVAYLLFSIYYFNVNKKTGIQMCGFIGSLILFSKLFMLLFSNYIFISTTIFIMSWVAQFAGHLVWEKNSPALLTSVKDAFTIAPLFCYRELEESYKISNKLLFLSQAFLGYLKKHYDTYKDKQLVHDLIDKDKTLPDINESKSESETKSESESSSSDEDSEVEKNDTDKKNE